MTSDGSLLLQVALISRQNHRDIIRTPCEKDPLLIPQKDLKRVPVINRVHQNHTIALGDVMVPQQLALRVVPGEPQRGIQDLDHLLLAINYQRFTLVG
jgi:hypothetical protein